MPADRDGILLCCKSDVPALPSDLLNLTIREIGGVRFIDVRKCIASAGVQFVTNLPVDRYLDKFYLWRCANPEDRQSMLDALFDYIAGDYDALIDTDRNIDNIRHLLLDLEILGVTSQNHLVADFGCGTGLAADVARNMGVNLVGVERCKAMAKTAAERGMPVWSPGELARQPQGILYGAFASYVFHILAQSDGLRLLWSRLRAGGVLVGNCHKGKGLKLVKDCLSEAGGSEVLLEVPSTSYEHGDYLAFIKRY